MTFRDLQDDLIEEIEKITKDIITKNANDEQVSGLKGYAHALPIIKTDDEDPEHFFPYFIVRFDNGVTKDDDDCWHVATDIIIGIHEMDTYGGHEHVLTAIQRIVDRFAYEPQLNKKYRADQDIEWAVGEDDTYPYYFGAVAIKFSTPKIGRKADYDYV